MKSVPRSSQNTVEFTASLPFSQHSLFQYLANCRWFRRVRANGRLDIGGYDYYLGTTWRNHMLELHFDAN